MPHPAQPLETRTGCIAGAMAIIGQKWTALLLRDLTAGAQRFADFERSIPQINPRTLSRRLDDLELNGVIRHDTNGSYVLTDKGRDLIPVIQQMAAWGEKYT